MDRRLAVDLLADLAWPVAVLTWASGEDALGPRWGPAVAMVGPLANLAWQRFGEGRTSAISGLVAVSIGLNAAAGFLPLSARWFAAKEALLPALFGALFAGTTLRGPGVLGELVDRLVEPERLRAALAARTAERRWQETLRAGTRRFGAVFAGSGLLGGALALLLVRSPTGSAGFAEELGRYTAWSYLVVNLPVLVGATWVLRGVLTELEDATGQRVEELRDGS